MSLTGGYSTFPTYKKLSEETTTCGCIVHAFGSELVKKSSNREGLLKKAYCEILSNISVS